MLSLAAIARHATYKRCESRSETSLPLPLSNHLPTSSAAVFVIFLVCCVLSSFRLIHNSMQPNLFRTANDVAHLSDQRFAAVKNELPARAVVGYMGESNDSATPDYDLTQYSLAPLVVRPLHKSRPDRREFPRREPSAISSRS